ncbi:MAG TPA: TIGR03619 family F420-dependent LLM class oxidoreductase [Candidatus Binatia bacterium]
MANLGLSFISAAPQVNAEFFLQLARKTEDVALHSLWINDRLVYDNFEPLAALAAAAGATAKIKLGTSVLLLPYRHPVLLAKTLATIDFISRGRLTLGVGIGNREADYDAVGVAFEQRGARGLESIQLMRRLWQEDNVTFTGKFFQVREMSLGPKPFNNRQIPIWMGGNVNPVLKRIGRFADGYICSTSAMANFPMLWEKVAKYAETAGRDPSKIERAGLNFLAIDDNEERAVAACAAFFERDYGKVPSNVETQMIVGPAVVCAERVAKAFEQGIHTLILGLIIPDLKQVDLLATKILPLLKGWL